MQQPMTTARPTTLDVMHRNGIQNGGLRYESPASNICAAGEQSKMNLAGPWQGTNKATKKEKKTQAPNSHWRNLYSTGPGVPVHKHKNSCI
jgi:hypothetical protein